MVTISRVGLADCKNNPDVIGFSNGRMVVVNFTDKSNSTDTQLIELAARAINLPECGWMGDSFMYVKDNTFTDWNPLTNREDARMIEQALSFSVSSACGVVQVSKRYRHSVYEHFDTSDQRTAATCRAITRAAAEIGATL